MTTNQQGPLLQHDEARYSWKCLTDRSECTGTPSNCAEACGRVLPDHADYPRGPTETALYFFDLEKKAIIYPTDKEVVCPDAYKVCGAVHRDLHRLHAHPEVRKETRKWWSGHLNATPERLEHPAHGTTAVRDETTAPCESHAAPCPDEGLYSTHKYTLTSTPTIDTKGRMPVPQDSLDSFRSFREANTVSSQQWRP